MQDETIQETTPKTIRFDNELIKTIDKMAFQSERDFSGQVRFMLKEYLRIKESK